LGKCWGKNARKNKLSRGESERVGGVTKSGWGLRSAKPKGWYTNDPEKRGRDLLGTCGDCRGLGGLRCRGEEKAHVDFKRIGPFGKKTQRNSSTSELGVLLLRPNRRSTQKPRNSGNTQIAIGKTKKRGEWESGNCLKRGVLIVTRVGVFWGKTPAFKIKEKKGRTSTLHNFQCNCNQRGWKKR